MTADGLLVGSGEHAGGAGIGLDLVRQEHGCLRPSALEGGFKEEQGDGDGPTLNSSEIRVSLASMMLSFCWRSLSSPRPE